MLALGLVLAAWLIWSTWIAVAHERADRASRVCADNMRALSRAMALYLADHDDTFPPANAWNDRLASYVSDSSVFVCPSGPKGRCSYAFSAKLAGLRADSLQDAWLTIVLFESDRGWNAAGGAELLPDKPRHSYGDRYLFADGRSFWQQRQWTPDERGQRRWTKGLKDEEVRWKPVPLPATESEPTDAGR